MNINSCTNIQASLRWWLPSKQVEVHCFQLFITASYHRKSISACQEAIFRFCGPASPKFSMILHSKRKRYLRNILATQRKHQHLLWVRRPCACDPLSLLSLVSSASMLDALVSASVPGTKPVPREGGSTDPIWQDSGPAPLKGSWTSRVGNMGPTISFLLCPFCLHWLPGVTPSGDCLFGCGTVSCSCYLLPRMGILHQLRVNILYPKISRVYVQRNNPPPAANCMASAIHISARLAIIIFYFPVDTPILLGSQRWETQGEGHQLVRTCMDASYTALLHTISSRLTINACFFSELQKLHILVAN